MNEETEAKIKVINQMITSLGKLTNVQIRLQLAGDTAGAAQVDEKRKALADVIENLRVQVAEQWTMDAAQLQEGLRKVNAEVQASIRAIQQNIGVAKNVTKVIGTADRALAALKNLVAP